jgi:hypothetical protein
MIDDLESHRNDRPCGRRAVANQADDTAGDPGDAWRTQSTAGRRPPPRRTQMRKLTLTVITIGAAAFAAASAATASTKTEDFTLMTTSTAAGKPVYSVIATGDFIDGGIATHVGKGGLMLHLSSGTITLDGKKESPRVTKTETATACMQTASTSITYTIGQGTGAYKGISGSGRATDNDTFVEQVVHGNCSTKFAAGQGRITASGPVSLP